MSRDDELRVLVEAFADRLATDRSYDGDIVEDLRALLTRTEAAPVADVADLIQWRYTNAETGEVLTPWAECDSAFREKRKDAPGYQFRELYTNPHDASARDGEVARLREAVELTIRGIESGNIKSPLVTRKVNGDYVMESLHTVLTAAMSAAAGSKPHDHP